MEFLDHTTVVVALLIVTMAVVMIAAAKAVQHDRAVKAIGPTQHIEQLHQSIRGLTEQESQKKEEIKSVEEELQQKRQAVLAAAGMQAEVDALVRRHDELSAEWEQMSTRREEVQKVRQETEKAQQAYLEVHCKLSEVSELLQGITEEYEAAKELLKQLEKMREEEAALKRTLVTLRTALEEAEKKIKEAEKAEAKRDGLAGEVRKLEGERDALRIEIDRAASELIALQGQLGAVTGRIATARAELEEQEILLAKQQQKVQAVTTEVEVKLEHLTRLQAEKDAFENAKQSSSMGGDKSETVSNALKELKEPPAFVADMRQWDEHVEHSEAEGLRRVQKRMASAGLTYSSRLIHAFHTAMKVNESTQLAVLAGISGTGKTQLPRHYAAGMGIGFMQVPVQPRWDSPQDLMGFYNYIEQRYRPTDMARVLYQFDQFREEIDPSETNNGMMLILFDEMNLARVEYYFADFLSKLESRPSRQKVRDQNARRDAEIELDIPASGEHSPRIFPGHNILFAGTMNEDESTQSLSDKVLDRANLLRFPAPAKMETSSRSRQESHRHARLTHEQWRNWQDASSKARSVDIVESLEKFSSCMTGMGRPFGHRLAQSIESYVEQYPAIESRDDRSRIALADQVDMRLLPKLRGLDVHDTAAEEGINELRDIAKDHLRDAELAKAIGESLDVAKKGTGSFVWHGVPRDPKV